MFVVVEVYPEGPSHDIIRRVEQDQEGLHARVSARRCSFMSLADGSAEAIERALKLIDRLRSGTTRSENIALVNLKLDELLQVVVPNDDEKAGKDTQSVGRGNKWRQAMLDAASKLALTPIQLKLRTSPSYRRFIIMVLMTFVFMDFVGKVLLLPTVSILCQQAEQGPLDQIALKMVAESNHSISFGMARSQIVPNPISFPNVPMKFALAANLLACVGMAGGGVAGFIFGPLSDRVGRKPCMLVALSGGIASFVLMYVAGEIIKSYWLFLAAMLLNGLFSAGSVVVTATLGDLFPHGNDKEPYLAMIGACNVMGGAAGSIILLPFSLLANSRHVFQAVWIPASFSVGALVLIAIFFEDPHKEIKEMERAALKKRTENSAELYTSTSSSSELPSPPPTTTGIDLPTSNTTEDASEVVVVVSPPTLSSEPPSPPPSPAGTDTPSSNESIRTPKLALKILVLAAAAGALDTAGDEGTRIARGTILQNTFPETNNVPLQTALALSLIGIIICALVTTITLKNKLGFGVLATIGAGATATTQFLLFIEWQAPGPFLAVWCAESFNAPSRPAVFCVRGWGSGSGLGFEMIKPNPCWGRLGIRDRTAGEFPKWEGQHVDGCHACLQVRWQILWLHVHPLEQLHH